MDEEDILDSKKDFRLNNIKLNNKIFKIRFASIFLICIGVLTLEQIMKYLDNLPELFTGGDCIFHFFQSILTICSQLGVSVAAAIIFYYLMEYVNVKKRKDDLETVRKYLLYTLYAHMNLVCNTKSFECLNRDKQRLKGSLKMFLIMDLPFFFYAYSETSNDTMQCDIYKYFVWAHNNDENKELLISQLCSFAKDIKELKGLRLISAYKGFRNNIEELCAAYEEFYSGVAIYKSEDNAECLEVIAEDYMLFFESTVETYCYIEKYIESLENSEIIQFMRLHE